jgi:hypothetical protein
VLFDLPHVISDGPRTLARHGVEDRAECAGGDFLESVPPGGDAYLLSLVLHDWPDDQARHILASVAGGSGARPLVLDFIVPPGDAPHMAKISDLNMLAMMGGKERTETEWRELLTAAGFAGIGIRQTGTPILNRPGNSAITRGARAGERRGTGQTSPALQAGSL